MRQRRKRSAAITLVLAGSLSGCGEPVPQRDVYTSADDCRRDWGQEQQACEPVRDGRFSPTWFYGPAYYGESWPSGRPKSSASAVEAVHLQRPASVARAPSRTFSGRSSTSGISRSTSGPSRSSTTSRGGFGSSARSSVS
jgi:hypothetical protein